MRKATAGSVVVPDLEMTLTEKSLSFDQVDDLQQGVGGQAVAGKVDTLR